jgi:hypothetical protein
MGTWGTSFYGSDFAADLRNTIRAVSRLPFDDERLAEIVAGTASDVALNPSDEDYCNFWIVVADQFLRRGITSTLVRDTALRIIDSGQDLETQRALGQSAGGLRKRSRMLTELRARLIAPDPSVRPRAVLRKPQPFLMDVNSGYRTVHVLPQPQ